MQSSCVWQKLNIEILSPLHHTCVVFFTASICFYSESLLDWGWCDGCCSNNLPIDIFGLYREVIRHGGFVDNERYDDYNRWTGGINFGGKVRFQHQSHHANVVKELPAQLVQMHKVILP